jgi:hypothetical protein
MRHWRLLLLLRRRRRPMRSIVRVPPEQRGGGGCRLQRGCSLRRWPGGGERVAVARALSLQRESQLRQRLLGRHQLSLTAPRSLSLCACVCQRSAHLGQLALLLRKSKRSRLGLRASGRRRVERLRACGVRQVSGECSNGRKKRALTARSLTHASRSARRSDAVVCGDSSAPAS